MFGEVGSTHPENRLVKCPTPKIELFFDVCFLIVVALEADSAYITCSTVVLQCYRRQAIPMEQADTVNIITDVSFRETADIIVCRYLLSCRSNCDDNVQW